MCGKTYPHEESLLTTRMRIAQHQLLQHDLERPMLLELCLGICDGSEYLAAGGRWSLRSAVPPFKTKASCSAGVWAMPDSKYPRA